MLGISWQIRLVLVLGSLITVAFVLRRVRQARMQIEDSIFWLLFACGPAAPGRPACRSRTASSGFCLPFSCLS